MPPRLRLFARPNAESFLPSLGYETFRRTSILWRDQRRAGEPWSSCDMGFHSSYFRRLLVFSLIRYSALCPKTSIVLPTHVLLLITAGRNKLHRCKSGASSRIGVRSPLHLLDQNIPHV